MTSRRRSRFHESFQYYNCKLNKNIWCHISSLKRGSFYKLINRDSNSTEIHILSQGGFHLTLPKTSFFINLISGCLSHGVYIPRMNSGCEGCSIQRPIPDNGWFRCPSFFLPLSIRADVCFIGRCPVFCGRCPFFSAVICYPRMSDNPKWG